MPRKIWFPNIYGMYQADIPQDLLSVANRLPHGMHYGTWFIEKSQRMVRFTNDFTGRHENGNPGCRMGFTISIPWYQGYLMMGDLHIKLYRENACEHCFHGVEAFLWSELGKSLAGG